MQLWSRTLEHDTCSAMDDSAASSLGVVHVRNVKGTCLQSEQFFGVATIGRKMGLSCLLLP